MPKHLDFLLVNAVIEACMADVEAGGISLSVVARRVFKLAETGESDFHTLKRCALEGARPGTPVLPV
jgi:hypothetical protein